MSAQTRVLLGRRRTTPIFFKSLFLGVVGAALLGLSEQALAQTTSAAPVYQPPLRGTTAGGRIGGGTRGADGRPITMSVLAPEHTGLTVSQQLRLYWYLSDDVDVDAELTVVDRQSTDPLLELSVAAPIKRGIHALDLARHGVSLAPGVRYEWFVALVVDPEQRSNDIVAGAEIERVAPDAALEGRLAGAGEDRRAAIYAGAGIWYDAVDAVSRAVAGAPAEPAPRARRAALLEQVGLDEAAAYDRGMNPSPVAPGEGPG
jgi:hypothetical protein